MRKMVIPLILIIVILIIAGYMIFQKMSRERQAGSIEISGSIETTEVDAGFQIGGKIKQLMVEEGDLVQKGQLLALLDEQDLFKQKQAAQANLESAQTQLPSLQTQISLSAIQASGKIAQAGSILDESQIRLKQLRKGLRPQEIQQAYKEVDAAKSAYNFMHKEQARAERLFKEGALPGQQKENIVSNYKIAQARYLQAQAKLSLALEGSRQEDIEAAQARVGQSQASLTLAQSSNLETEKLQQQQKTQEAQIRQAQANLAYLGNQLAHAKLYAPISGTVLIKAKENGEVVSPGAPIVTLGDINKVWLKAYIGETDLGRVNLGQKVDVTNDTYPDKTYSGKIYYIATTAEFTPKNLQTKEDRVKLVYRIKVSLDNPNQELKPGMIADGKIIINPSSKTIDHRP